MTGSNPVRPADGHGGRQPPADPMPDPWGVRRAENLLTSLEGVLSARVVTTPLGEVSEIHILAQAGLSPKQLVRNVESALLAHLGLKVDHRKISVAQTAEVKPIETLDRAAVRERAMQRAVLFEDVAVQSAHPDDDRWGGWEEMAAAEYETERSLARAQALLGTQSVLVGRPQGGRMPVERVEWPMFSSAA